ncbi:MAG TPA: 4-phosphoerythronate dehydrogenase [Kiritimatiellia bacterium]|nr:4-phosphoerythronate dehydrogenase [Kiritimatiellia bacterium]
MKIVCATSVTLGREAFSTIGEVAWIPEREITPDVVRDADLLIARSKVKLNRALLDGSRVAFAATATAGVDHVDAAYLEEKQIAWTSAPGSNANSVAEWVAAGLLHLATRHGVELEGRTLGIIGVGNVGTRVAAMAPALGLRVLLNDPPRAAAQPGAMWCDLDTLLAQADIVTLHVPLTDAGPYATRELVDFRFLSGLKSGAIFLNASRGEVVDEDCLRHAVDQHCISHALLDVFAHEPDVDPRTAAIADLVTPHIAGYSYEGRVRGTDMCYRAACRFLELDPRWAPPPLPPDPAREFDADPRGRTEQDVLAEIVARAYDITADDQALRTGLGPDAAARRSHFQSLRARYADRLEFPAFTVRAPARSALASRLGRLGFTVRQD